MPEHGIGGGRGNDGGIEESENLLNNAGRSTEQHLQRSYSYEAESTRQTSGEDTGGRHHHTQSWTGDLSDFANDVLAGNTSSPGPGQDLVNASSRPPPPPPPRPRRHSLERDYHLRNQKFLQQIAAQKVSRNRTPYASPSPNTKFRKQLNAIEEDGQSLVIIDGSDRNLLETAPMSDSNRSLPEFYDSDELTTIKWQDNDGNDSVLSSLAGSYCNMMSVSDAERFAKFEQEQEERFHEKKHDMQEKLRKALDTSPIKAERDKKEFINAYMQDLELERAALMTKWKAEMMMEEERYLRQDSFGRLVVDCCEVLIKPCVGHFWIMFANTEVVLSNMPLTIGAVGLSWVTMGVVWFKFMEEMVDSCHLVDYFSEDCKYQEFPGCFECDVDNSWYKVALTFHQICSTVSGIACLLIVFKVIMAPNVVLDMLKNPTTCTPVGVWCMAMVCTFAGQHGLLGELIVLITSSFHVILAFWFLYMAFFKFRLWADPGWFPSVVGISYAAVKTWIYLPDQGLVLMLLCTFFFLATFFISVVRVALNHKIAAPVCWIQLSAPSITLYALTLISQPTQQEKALFEQSQQAKEQFHMLLTNYYLPTQHLFMTLTLLGLASAVHSLYVRWPTFKTKPFSPAHIAFCFPTLSHANAIQAYRASVNGLSSLPPDSLFKKLLFCYYSFFLVAGTILNLVFTVKYIKRIPQWTKLDLTGEEELPAPSQTIIHGIMEDMDTHETLKQSFVSPAVLEANEAGVLVRVRRGTEDYRMHGPFARTRKVPSLGFDLIMDEMELQQERARLLECTRSNAPRRRHRTMSDIVGFLNFYGRCEQQNDTTYGTFYSQTYVETGRSRFSTDTGA